MAMLLDQLASRLGATVIGDGKVTVTGCASIETAQPDEVTFLANRRYMRYLEDTKAAGVLIDPDTPCPEGLTRLVCPDPYFAFRNALIEFHGFRDHPVPMDAPEPANVDDARISARAVIHPSASIGDRTSVHPHTVIERGAKIGRDCVLYPGTFIGPGAVVGDACLLYPGVVVYDGSVLGNRVTIHSGTVIGQDGFGYATHDGRHQKIPQTGTVVIEDDVELGAGCAIERAAIGETRIGAGTKFADLISIGHGTRIGAHCLFVSLVGVSGSVEVGNYVALGGQVGVSGHLKIGDGVQAMGKTAIVQDVPAGKRVGGIPAVDGEQAKRNALAAQDLYGLFKRMRRLEREVARLRGARDEDQSSAS